MVKHVYNLILIQTAFKARNIRDNHIIENLLQFSCMWIKVNKNSVTRFGLSVMFSDNH